MTVDALRLRRKFELARLRELSAVLSEIRNILWISSVVVKGLSVVLRSYVYKRLGETRVKIRLTDVFLGHLWAFYYGLALPPCFT